MARNNTNKKTIVDVSQAIHTLYIGERYVFGKNGSVTVGFEVKLPNVNTLSGNDFYKDPNEREGANLLGVLIKAIKHLETGYIFHQQDVFYYDEIHVPNISNSALQNSVQLAFNEKTFMNTKTFIFITQPNSNFDDDKTFSEQRRNAFNEVINSFMAAISVFHPKEMDEEDWVSYFESIFSCNFDKNVEKPLLQIDFKAGKFGDMKMAGYATTGDASIETISGRLYNQARSAVGGNEMYNSWVYPICWEIGCYKIINNIIQKANPERVKRDMRTYAGRLGLLGVGLSNNSKIAAEFANIIDNEENNATPVYHSFNCFFVYPQDVAKRVEDEIVRAFQIMTFRESQLTINLENIFLGSLGGGNPKLSYPEELYPLLLNEAVCFSNLENSTAQHSQGVVLNTTQDRPVIVDLLEEPARAGVINNFNWLCFGPSGTGKSVTLNKFISSWIALDYFVIVIDIGNSYRPLSDILNARGKKSRYIAMDSGGQNLSFNPFINVPLIHPDRIASKEDRSDYDEEIEILVDLLFLAWDPDGEMKMKNSASMRTMNNLLKDFYRKRFEENKEHVNFDDFYEFIRAVDTHKPITKERDYFDYPNFKLVMQAYTNNGDWGFLFNGTQNFFDVTDLNMLVLELEALENRPTLYKITCAMIMILARQIIDKAKNPYKMLMLDEAWRLIADPYFGEFIARLYRTIRKKGAGIGLAIQDFATLYDHPTFASVIMTNTDTVLLLSHESKKDLLRLNQTNLTLTNSMLSSALSLSNEKHEIFIKQGNNVSIYRVNLTPMELFIFSTTKADRVTRGEYLVRSNNNMLVAALEYLNDKTKKTFN